MASTAVTASDTPAVDTALAAIQADSQPQLAEAVDGKTALTIADSSHESHCAHNSCVALSPGWRGEADTQAAE